jgi:hypothetical protein
MLIIFFDIKWIVNKELVLTGQTVNSAYYCDDLLRLRENGNNSPRNLAKKKWLLHHDNTPSHTSISPGNFLPKTI